MSSTNKETLLTSVKLLRPNEEGYQEWAEKALEVIRGKYGGYANYLKKKVIPSLQVKHKFLNLLMPIKILLNTPSGKNK
jgi:hypothetical protein